MIGEVGILRLCGWFVINLEWIVIAIPNLLLLGFGLILLGSLLAIPFLIAEAVSSIQRKWYNAMEQIAQNLDQEEIHEHDNL